MGNVKIFVYLQKARSINEIWKKRNNQPNKQTKKNKEYI